ncbi:hypothetical protein [Zhongshania sp. BJYM1]|uniref:hypothetical protein n=1 Tax=Zhongshania aquatica TaxID=2965069 RepID=UPI0022B2D672|nr:hypothetical protein [Marortus sp. BJYM1]
MHNLRFWNNAVGLIESLESINSGGSDCCMEDVLSEFSETYHGYFDPRNALEEYMFVALVECVVRNVSSQGCELS